MTTVPHRELRNSSSEILRRVEAGESFVISNNGRAVARLIPYARSPLEALRDAGRVTARTRVDIATLPFVTIADGATSEEILDDLRGDR
ncbi:type II toxin-antitoxin system Phd/YefM family antitoxin [Brachybacterium sp. DNPG3]